MSENVGCGDNSCACEQETGAWPYGRIIDAVVSTLRAQQARWEAFVEAEAERAEKAEARVAELEAQAATDDAHALVVNDAHLKTVAALRARVAELEQQKDDLKTMIQDLRKRAESAEANRDEAVAALRALLREEWYIYEGNLEAAGHASVDDLNAARAVLAKYPEAKR